MFKFKDLSNTEDELFRPENYQLSVKDFLQNAALQNEFTCLIFEVQAIMKFPICLVRIIFPLSTSKIQSIKCLSLETFYFTVEGKEKH